MTAPTLSLIHISGYGYAKVSQSEKEKWGKMIERYLHTSKNLKAVFLLIDIRHDPSANDKMMYDWILNNGYEPIIIATKLDKLKRSQVQKNIKAIKEGLKPVSYTHLDVYKRQDQDKNQLPIIARDYFGPKAPEAMKTPIFEPIACQNL